MLKNRKEKQNLIHKMLIVGTLTHELWALFYLKCKCLDPRLPPIQSNLAFNHHTK